jgi:hypothetical protein
MGFVVEKVTLGHHFSEDFGFPLQIIMLQMLHIHLPTGVDIIDPFLGRNIK